jgi:beta-lactamase regulating signal transducer with metallopeptidase domain
MVVPLIYSEPLPLLGKIVIAAIVIVCLILFVRAYIRNRRL